MDFKPYFYFELKLPGSRSNYMNRWSFVVVLCLSIMLIPVFGTSAINFKNPDTETIEKIENKYKEIRNYEGSHNTPKRIAHATRFIQPEDKVVKDYGNLRQIALIRHGEPDMKKTGRFNAKEAQQFLTCYDTVCIVVPDQPFFKFEKEEKVKIFSSPLNRAFTTAKYLCCGKENDITVSKDFREFEINMDSRHSNKRLPIKFWTITSRIKWMFGRSSKQKNIETFSEAKERAGRAAQILEEASKKNNKVLLTAHGFLNRYIKKELIKKGWKVVDDNGNQYLGTTILVKI